MFYFAGKVRYFYFSIKVGTCTSDTYREVTIVGYETVRNVCINLF